MSSSSNFTSILPAVVATSVVAAASACYVLGQPRQSRTDDVRLYDIDYSMHKEHRELLLKRFADMNDRDKHRNSAIILDGGEELNKYDTDTTHAFRQESFFQYLFGVREPGCRGFIDVDRQKCVLLVPRYNAEWELWCGKRMSLVDIQSHYGVDAVHYIDDTAAILRNHGVLYLYRLYGVNSDSGLVTTTKTSFPGIESFTLNDSVLHTQLVECRVFKTDKELRLMRFVNALSSKAHIHVMKAMKPGLYEFNAESEFLYRCYSMGGARLHAYTCICGSGNNAATLHYGHAGAPNDKQLQSGELFLNDMGAELHGYASDITCTFPVSGSFSSDQRIIYEGVLKSHDAVIAAMKPGVAWSSMHVLSHTVLTQHLMDFGLFRNGTLEQLMQHEISCYFYPHGLGHLMGLDVHDVGGYPVGAERSETRMLRKLRCDRVLESNMVITVEPGCYFIDAQLEDLMADPVTAKFIDTQILDRFRGTGGVRIESDVIVTANGADNMTQVPRTVKEIEEIMK